MRIMFEVACNRCGQAGDWRQGFGWAEIVFRHRHEGDYEKRVMHLCPVCVARLESWVDFAEPADRADRAQKMNSAAPA